MSPSRLLHISLALLFTVGLPAQTTPNPSPTPPTLRVFTREIVVDINVTDAKGLPVHDLTKDDFTVFEDGKPIVPRSFREHRSDQEAGDLGPVPVLAPNTFTNDGPPPSTLPLNMLLFDATDTPIATQAVVRQRMAEFVDKVPAGSRFAVFALSPTGTLSLVQGFTPDRDLLKKAIKSKKLDLGIPLLEDFGQEPIDNIAPPPPTTGAPAPRSTAALLAQSQQVNPNMECNHAATREAYVEAALAQIARFASGMPGRKNLLWYTGAFPTRLRDKQNAICYDATPDLIRVDGLLGRAHVAVYPIDPRALDALARNAPNAYPVRVSVWEHGTMDGIAEDTGGRAYYNTNDLAGAAIQAIDVGSNYYSISYSPSNQNFDTRFRTIKVAVDKPDLNLVYMRGYHAVPAGQTVASSKPVDTATPMQSAMVRGALQPSEILFDVGVAVAPAPEATLLPNNNADPQAMKPPFRHLTLSYVVDINGIQFDAAADGSYHGQFEYAVDVYNPTDGRLLNSSTLAAKPGLPPAVYQNMLSTGAKLRQEIDIPAKGDYILRVGLHDLTTDRVGAIEIPVSAVHP